MNQKKQTPRQKNNIFSQPSIAPATAEKIRKSLLDWYDKSQRKLPWRKNTHPYPVWVSEVMLQQTRVTTVIPYFERFMAAFPRMEYLACADSQQVLKLWEGLGYYARARNLQKASRIVVSEYGGVIPHEYHEFRKLPGVGDYISNAVLSIAFGKTLAAVDANVRRVLARLLCMDEPVNHSSSQAVYQKAADELVSHTFPGAFNQAMMELGALVCTPSSPSCNVCPLSCQCSAFASGKTSQFPVRMAKKKIPSCHIAAGVVQKGNRMLITRRNPKGLLGGLWEFPGGKVEKGESASEACIREIFEETGIRAKDCSFLTRICHAYTHFRIEMDVFLCRYASGRICLNGPIDYQWVTKEELADFPFPKANLKFMPLLLDNK